jgi:plasmid replication initiation protein
VLPSPGDRLPGTFDQDVYVELLRRYHEAGSPADGTISFTLHSFLRTIGRRADGRTYEQLRSALTRLERTGLESEGAYYHAASQTMIQGRFSVLSAVSVERRRQIERDQYALFPSVTSAEPGDASVTLSSIIRSNIEARHTVTLSADLYATLSSPVARRLYRLLEVAREEGKLTWRVSLVELISLLPLTQRFPSHLQRVLQPAHQMLMASGLVRDAAVRQYQREWYVDYMLGSRVT